ncbi:Zinc finger protein 224 [Araneus ventricosus]|uniref:Zinc finger protein 224 n=2 Tax=Araneus ventricosus TaxID=182803 RepID=A0A4Y2QBU8_ARAVE|nr:Zinc finger protein 224 [Araneus ventricosus]
MQNHDKPKQNKSEQCYKEISHDCRVNEVPEQETHTSQQQTRIEGGVNRRKRAPTSKKGFKCWKCRKGFANESELNIHMQKVCEPNQYKSDQCPKEFSHNWLVNDVPEQEAHTSQQQIRIEGRENALIKRVSTSKKGFKCRNCRKGFANESELNIHRQNICEPNQYKCGECSEEFSCDRKLKEHLVVHWEVKPFECEHCDLAFKWKNHLTSHMNKYHESEIEAYYAKQESKKELKSGKCS